MVRPSAFSRHEDHSQIVDNFIKENETTVFVSFYSGIQVSCSNICVTLSNIPYLPFTKRAAPSSLSELYFRWGCQTVALYSRKDLTRKKYAVSLSFSGQPFSLRLRKDNLESALAVMTSMCFIHYKLSLTITPRYLASFTSSSICPDNSYW